MPKTSGLPEDTQPTSDDFSISLDSGTGVLKKVKWQNLRKLFATKRVDANVTSANPTPNADTDDVYTLTGLAANCTVGQPSGSPSDGQSLVIRIKDDGSTARTIAWHAIYRPVGVTLPTSTVTGKTMYIGCLYNNPDNCWDVLSISRQS